MPKGHAKNEEQKRMKCRLAALGNQNMLGKRYKQKPDRAFNAGRYVKGRLNPNKGIPRLEYMREKNPNWISDRTLLKKKEQRNDSAYHDWRRQVWMRDDFKCKIANLDCEGRIEAHHILVWSQYPELRYKINNGITLCHAHHPRKRAEEKRLVPYFMGLVSVSKD
jgi:hypothetical protein